MIDPLEGPPALDAHAHIADDVTARQVHALGRSHIFAMTRSISEAARIPTRYAQHLTWGIGVHPATHAAQAQYDERGFAALLRRFALIGEIGLDRRAGDLDRQTKTLTSILRIAADEPVLLSMHSAGAANQLIDILEQYRHPGTILHWWTEHGAALDRAIASGAYFSVNAAMSAEIIGRLPKERVLTETDFPARRAGARKPGDTAKIEAILQDRWGMGHAGVRSQLWLNLRRLATSAHALDRLPGPLVDILESV
jgi:TatD DNase family protein